MAQDGAVPDKDKDEKDPPKQATPKPVGKHFTRRGTEKRG